MKRFALLLPVLTATLAGQTAPSKDEDDLLALLNTPITVASKKALTTRESPGIVTLIRRDEILASGARDLMELLSQVPGFAFGADVQGVVGVGVRGAWGHEGKVLLLLDGQEMNELRYGTLQFGGHFPLDTVKQVEIIRGPGSAIYGGFAEIAVVNVITQDGADLMGGSLTFAEDRAQGGVGHRLYSLAGGWGGPAWKASLAYSGGLVNLSDGAWMDGSGNPVALKDRSRREPRLLNFGGEWQGLSLRVLLDRYSLTDFTDFRPENPSKISFDGDYAELKYQWKLGPSFSLTPRLTYKSQSPWVYSDTEGQKRTVKRTQMGLQASWSPHSVFDLTFGGESTQDEGRTPASRPWSNGGTKLSYSSSALFVQGTLNTAFVNVTLGGRYDKHEIFGNSFVPRLALTKAWGRAHVKFLASRAFRAPVVENLELNATVEPEKTTALEAEFGFQAGPTTYVSLNAFDLQIKKPIVYQFIAGGGPGGTDLELYNNYPRTGSRGFELDLLMKGGFGFLHATYSYSQARRNEVPDYAVSADEGYLLGLPNAKFTVLSSFKLNEAWSFEPGFFALGPRYGYDGSGVRRFESTAVVNAQLTWKAAKGLELSLRGRNLTDAELPVLQAYSGGSSPLPSPGRELGLRASYHF